MSARALADDPVTSPVTDGAGLFRTETVARAERLIRDLQRQYHFDVRVETLALPPDEVRKLEGMAQRRSKALYFVELGRQRAANAAINGLDILVSTAPRHVQITVYPRSAESLFSSYQQRQLHKLL